MSNAWSRKEWKAYAKELEAYVADRFERLKYPGKVTVIPAPTETSRVKVVTVPEKWVANLILAFRTHYCETHGRAPSHVFLPAIYLEKLLHDLPPGTLHGEMMVFGIRIVTKSRLAPPPFSMWEERRGEFDDAGTFHADARGEPQ